MFFGECAPPFHRLIGCRDDAPSATILAGQHDVEYRVQPLERFVIPIGTSPYQQTSAGGLSP